MQWPGVLRALAIFAAPAAIAVPGWETSGPDGTRVQSVSPAPDDDGRAYAAAITAVMTGEAYAQSARIARDHGGPFSGYDRNRDAFLRVMRKHRDAVGEINPKVVLNTSATTNKSARTKRNGELPSAATSTRIKTRTSSPQRKPGGRRYTKGQQSDRVLGWLAWDMRTP